MKNSITLIWCTVLGMLTPACGPSSHDASHKDEQHPESDAQHHEDEVHLDPAVAIEQGVVVSTAETRRIAPTVTVPARVTLSQDGHARVASPVEGRLVEFLVATGSSVEAGDPLAVLHSPAFATAQREFTLASLASEALLPQVTLQRASWQRAVTLNAQQGDPSLAEVKRREAELRQLEAEHLAAEGRFQQQGDSLRLWGVTDAELTALLSGGVPKEQYLLRAPLAGRVIERTKAIGEYAGPDHETVIAIADLNRLWVIANFPESRLRTLRVGAIAMVRLESEPEHGCPAHVEFVSPVLDLSNRTVEVRIVPEDQHEGLLPGQFARAEIELALEENASADVVAVPVSAVARLDGEEIVFVLVPDEPGAFAPRHVRTGRAVGGWIPILEGLEAGESYVSEGAFVLKAELEKGSGSHDH